MKIPCPKCGKMIEYNPYFKAYYCDCGYFIEDYIQEFLDLDSFQMIDEDLQQVYKDIVKRRK